MQRDEDVRAGLVGEGHPVGERHEHILLAGEEHLHALVLQRGLEPASDVERDGLLQLTIGADGPFLRAAVPRIHHYARARCGAAARSSAVQNARAEDIRPGMLLQRTSRPT